MRAFSPASMAAAAAASWSSTISAARSTCSNTASADRAGFILLSTSRVYSIAAAGRAAGAGAEAPSRSIRATCPPGISARGHRRRVSPPRRPSRFTAAPSSPRNCWRWNTAKRSTFPVWINRCGVLAGAGQFGQRGAGHFQFLDQLLAAAAPAEIHRLRRARALRSATACIRAISFRCSREQFADADRCACTRIINVGGGVENSMSLAQLSDWCAARFGPREVASDPTPAPVRSAVGGARFQRSPRRTGTGARRPRSPIDSRRNRAARRGSIPTGWSSPTP